MPDLDVLPTTYAVCRLEPDSAPPPDALCLVRSADELSAVVPEAGVRPDWAASRGWRCLRVRGPLDLSSTGVLASLLVPLADARVSVFPFASYDTDWILVPGDRLDDACAALRVAGHTVHA